MKILDIFEDVKENKLEYTEIFNNYTKMIEDVISKTLTQKIEVRPLPLRNKNDIFI